MVKTGQLWALEIPAEDTKMQRALDYPVSPELSERIDVYLSNFRCRIPGADTHDGLWASDQGPVNLHPFRHAAATFWSIRNPENVRGAKDLLGQSSFGTTEKYYIMAQSRLAGRALARVVESFKERSLQSP